MIRNRTNRAIRLIRYGGTLLARRRLVAHLSAGDADNAAREVEAHLRVLLYMGRLAMTAATATTDR